MRAWLLALALLPACGGKVVLDGSGTTGGGGAATTGTMSSAGGGGSSSCPSPCPMFVPDQGSACACAGETCGYDGCPMDGSMITATCSGGAWQLVTAGCLSIPCGTASCMIGSVCLHMQGGAPATEMCIPDPCGTMPLACACATSVCPDDCLSTTASDLVCGCATCP